MASSSAVVRGLEQGQRAALLISECQRGVLDPGVASFPGLAEQVETRGVLGRIATLATGFRAAGLPVVHAHIGHRPDYGGVVPNSMLAAMSMRGRLMITGTPSAEAMDEVTPAASDFVSVRNGRLSMWEGTDLDPTLRSLGVDTVVLTGVSTNIALFGSALGALDRYYRVVLVEDAAAGASAETHDWMVANTFPLLASIATTDEVLAAIATAG